MPETHTHNRIIITLSYYRVITQLNFSQLIIKNANQNYYSISDQKMKNKNWFKPAALEIEPLAELKKKSST